ncbi:hypothetical protein PYCCODRAFT_340907 [Trametes coccinea BRFM310]|uniref:C2H2-type domain-containing protein n=1 Tax=Trametes coccinea (strain BRFM310) TaxID=1353009 RepID=A0A1Y2J2P8_TRAC3|nr:hypothetical protein PYCCODRAFT_340907 [Trametes coccinea BRFM310]
MCTNRSVPTYASSLYTVPPWRVTHPSVLLLHLVCISQEQEAGPIAGPSHVTPDVAGTVPDVEDKEGSPEPATQEPPAKRRRRNEADLQDDRRTTKARICGVDGCTRPLTKSIEVDRKHVREDHYKVKSAYSVGSSSQSAGSSSSSMASRSQSPGEASASDAEVGETERLRCRHGACESTFARMQDLMKHIEGSHWGCNFKCDKCGREFPQRWRRDRHMKSKSCSKKASKPRRGKK